MSARCVDCLNEAIERCEVTGVPLCAGCLWYADDGRRISEREARKLQDHGTEVFSPQLYLQQLGTAARLPSLPEAHYTNTRFSNGNDLVATLAAITGLISMASCFGIGLAICAAPLPLMPLILGGVGLAGSRNAARPEQARFLSWIGVAGGAGFLSVVLLFVIGAAAFGTKLIMPWSPLALGTPTFGP